MSSILLERLDGCFAAFKRALANDGQVLGGGDRQLADQFDRLKLWTYDVEIRSEALEKRLANASSLTKLLSELFNDLHQELSVISNPAEIDQLDGISDIIDDLFSLESSVKAPAPLDEIESLSGGQSNAAEFQLRKLNLVFQSTRQVADNPDIDIIIVGAADSDDVRHALNWCESLLPSFLQEQDIHARIMSFAYESSCWMDGTHKAVIHDIVQELNLYRARDPERPLQFVAHGLSSFMVRGAISALLAEGLSVDMDRPVSGCIFLDVQKEIGVMPEDFPSSDTLHHSSQKQRALADILHVNLTFQQAAQEREIQVHRVFESEGELRMEPEPHGGRLPLREPGSDLRRIDLSDRETTLPMAHKVAQTAELAVIARREALARETDTMDTTKSHIGRGDVEDPFAILAAYHTAVLVNDCSAATDDVWTSIVNIVRDCIDMITGWRDELDLQLQHSEEISYGMRDSSVAARILGSLKLPARPWNLTKQLQTYIEEYLASDNPSGRLSDGSLCPCNVVVLTQDVPMDQTPETLVGRLNSLARAESDRGTKILPLHVQIVYLRDDASSPDHVDGDKFFAKLDDLARNANFGAVKIAPTFRLNHKYVSNAEVLKRILLGGLSSRFEVISFTSADLGQSIGSQPLWHAGSATSSEDDGDDVFTRGTGTRHTGSTAASSVDLDFTHLNTWSGLGPYRSHKRIAGDDFESSNPDRDPTNLRVSNQASPYMPTYNSFEGWHESPLLDPQENETITNELNFQRFGLEEERPLSRQNKESTNRSPRISPQLLPQQPSLPLFTTSDSYGMNVDREMFPPFAKPESPSDFGLADQMDPPEISVEFAPPTNVSHSSTGQEGLVLSPPARTQSSDRRRAVSDSSTSISGRGRSPSLQPYRAKDDLSRSPSPAKGRDKHASGQKHVSDQRDYILNLAEPERSPSGVKDSGRVQKHPATFQCTLCPKRFTRAYNLRSHMRMHTDERPFVCTVCGKAFARQHDRKRHEGLHSGEKKFVCKGTLTSGGQWGCGRRFARADALGRHFRSEAGRVCIKPLLDEEALERQRAWIEEQQAAQVAAGLVTSQPLTEPPQTDADKNYLPAVLLQQYPALRRIDWSAIPMGPTPDEPDEEFPRRSSFEHSGGDYYEYDEYPDTEMGGMDPRTDQKATFSPGMGLSYEPGKARDFFDDFEDR